MKEKIKKFYEEHKAEAILVATMVLGTTAAVAYHKNAMDGMDVLGLNEFATSEGEQILVARRKNGSTMTFRKNPNK